jgi:hypothetical protein
MLSLNSEGKIRRSKRKWNGSLGGECVSQKEMEEWVSRIFMLLILQCLQSKAGI